MSDEITREIARLDYEYSKNEAAERLRYQVEFGQAVLRGLTLVNGGAIVALFTFIGSSPASVDPALVKAAFASFAVGLGLTILATFAAFFSQGFYMQSTAQEMWNSQDVMHGREGSRDHLRQFRYGEWALWAGIAAASLALISFVLGAWWALSAVLVEH